MRGSWFWLWYILRFETGARLLWLYTSELNDVQFLSTDEYQDEWKQWAVDVPGKSCLISYKCLLTLATKTASNRQSLNRRVGNARGVSFT